MAPTCVLLDDDVRLVASTGEKTCGGQSMSSFSKPLKGVQKSSGGMSFADRVMRLIKGGGGSGEEEPRRQEDLMDWVQVGRVTVDTDIVQGPEISTLSLHLPATPNEICTQIQAVTVASADKNLLVLFTGPPFDCYSLSGRYLVYDTANDVLFSAPPIDLIGFREIFGCRPVIVRLGDGCSEFILAQLSMSNDTTTGHCYLSMWFPFASEGEVQEWGKVQGWVHKEACLPDDVAKYPFMTDVAFAFQGRWACWVDLNFGMVTCDLLSPDPQLYSKLLPENYVMNLNSKSCGRPDMYSTMGCVNGQIRFLFMDGCRGKKCPTEEVTISTWTLKEQVPGLCFWVKDDYTKLSVGELWSDKSFLAIPGLPQCLPICPVLNPTEPDIVYFFLTDIDYVDGRLTTKGEHVLGLNLQSKQV